MGLDFYRSARRLAILISDVRGNRGRLHRSASLGEDANVITDVVANHFAGQKASASPDGTTGVEGETFSYLGLRFSTIRQAAKRATVRFDSDGSP